MYPVLRLRVNADAFSSRSTMYPATPTTNRRPSLLAHFFRFDVLSSEEARSAATPLDGGGDLGNADFELMWSDRTRERCKGDRSRTVIAGRSEGAMLRTIVE